MRHLVAPILLAAILVACPESNYRIPPPPPPISITIEPANVTLLPRRVGAFFASTRNTLTNSAVRWEISGGEITPSGLYRAPDEVGEYTVRAVSVEDPTKTAQATVSVTCPPTNHSTGIETYPMMESLGGRPGRVNALFTRSDGSLIAAGHGIFRLATHDAHIGVWERVGNRLSDNKFSQIIEVSDTLYARSRSGVERLDPATNTWQGFGETVGVTNNPGLAAGTDGWIYLDGGISGTQDTTVYRVNRTCTTPEPVPGLIGSTVQRLESDAGGTVYAATERGIFTLAPGQTRFTALTVVGLPTDAYTLVNDFLFEPGRTFIAGSRVVYRLDAGASAWQRVDVGGSAELYPQRLLRRSNGDLVMYDGSRLFRLDGKTWVPSALTETSVYPAAMVEHRGEIYVGMRHGVVAVRDLTPQALLRPAGERGLPGSPETLVADASGTLYAAFPGIGIFVRGAQDLNWSPLALPSGYVATRDIAVTPEGRVYFKGATPAGPNLIETTIFSSANSHSLPWTSFGRPEFAEGLRVTPDGKLVALRVPFDGGGLSFWTGSGWATERPVPGTRFSDLVFDASGNGYASINMIGQSDVPVRGVYRRDATTRAWTAFTEGLGSVSVRYLEIDPQGVLYAMTIGSIYRRAPNERSWTLAQDLYTYEMTVDARSRFYFSRGKDVYSGLNAAKPNFESPEGSEVKDFVRGPQHVYGVDESGVFRLPLGGQ